MTTSLQLASIGYGAMARSLRDSLARSDAGIALQACLLSPTSTGGEDDGPTRFTDVDALIAAGPELVVECATHAAVRDTVPQLLGAGIDVIIVSIGALADPATRARVEEAARLGGARATAVAGAVGGLDALRAAACAGLDEVAYVGRKPPGAWKGTPAEELLDLDGLCTARAFYQGSAAEAARDYPRNANVCAAIALAGAGFEATRVTLVADPDVRQNVHEIVAVGAFGRFSITLENQPLPQNPKTSWLAALSVEQAVRRHFACLDV